MDFERADDAFQVVRMKFFRGYEIHFSKHPVKCPGTFKAFFFGERFSIGIVPAGTIEHTLYERLDVKGASAFRHG